MKISRTLQLSSLAILTSVFLFACGGSLNNKVAEGGISGTGITMGRITNFGSIFVNGVQFDVDNATFVRDKAPSSGQAEFRIGEFVVISGNVNAAGTSGVATNVTFTDLLEGAVTTASNDNVTIRILGQSVVVDQLTVFHGFTVLNDLTVGNIVEVSGVRDAAGLIEATSITLKQTRFQVGVSENELKGILTNLDLASQTFSINNFTIRYGGARLEGFGGQALQNGQFVEAKSNSAIVANVLVATKIELEDEYETLSANTEAEIEGLVTRFNSIASFDVNGLAVITNSSTVYKKGAASNIGLNVFLEVEGTVNASGILVADEIKFKEAKSAIKLKGNIESINLSTNEIVILNQVIVIDRSTIMIDESDQNVSPLTINDLVIGDEIEIKGAALSNGKILASKLEREND